MFFKINKEKIGNIKPILKTLYDGICYNLEDDIYYIRGGQPYRFYSDRAFRSWSLIPVEADYTWPPEYLMPKTLGFRDGTLIQNAKDGKIYVISNARKRLLTAPLGDYGFDYSQVIEVSDAEAEFHQDGEEI